MYAQFSLVWSKIHCTYVVSIKVVTNVFVLDAVSPSDTNHIFLISCVYVWSERASYISFTNSP